MESGKNFIWKKKIRAGFSLGDFGTEEKISLTGILEKMCVYVQPIQDDGLLCNS
jgi:hypothetical protein